MFLKTNMIKVTVHLSSYNYYNTVTIVLSIKFYWYWVVFGNSRFLQILTYIYKNYISCKTIKNINYKTSIVILIIIYSSVIILGYWSYHQT